MYPFGSHRWLPDDAYPATLQGYEAHQQTGNNFLMMKLTSRKGRADRESEEDAATTSTLSAWGRAVTHVHRKVF
jgi:hypothetical protein